MPSLETLKVTDFEPRNGEAFRLRAPDRELALELVEVHRLGDSGREGGAFSLLSRALPPGIGPIGTMEMSSVPPAGCSMA